MQAHSLSPNTAPGVVGNDEKPGDLSLQQFTDWLLEIQHQPSWRGKADKEMDFVDGNQLESELLQRQKDLGIPPAIEPLIGPAIDAVLGLEAKTRTDWRVTPASDRRLPGAEDVADALNYQLNEAERTSGADRACSDAFKPQAAVGLGWVEVGRNTDPFKPKYRCKAVHRNEIFWDWLAKEPDLSDARYLIRRRWTDVKQAMLKFPLKKDLIRTAGLTSMWGETGYFTLDGASIPPLASDWMQERGWSIEEMEWRDTTNARVCLFEVWHREWEEVVVIHTLDGRVVEYDKNNPVHTVAIAAGVAKPQRCVIARMYLSYWMGPHKLYCGRSPYQHNDFPYVPFWGKREDRTMVPYGQVRGMMYLQESVNSAISKIRWGLSAYRVERTKGAVAMTDERFRQMVARPDADIVLDDAHMAKAGAKFEVHRDFQLNEQQYKMLQDARLGIQRSSGITASFQGQEGTARSGVQEATQIEQTTQQLADLMDNFQFARRKVGELLLSMLIEDLKGKENHTIVIPKDPLHDERSITLNVPVVEEGLRLLNNDIERIKLAVALSDVPSTPSFRAQQLTAMSESFKAMPQEVQVAVLPHLLNLMDVPDKDTVIEAVKQATMRESPEEIQLRIDKAVADAIARENFNLKREELGLKYPREKLMAEIRNMMANTVLTGVQAAFQSMQAGAQVAAMPAITPVADAIMQAMGYTPPNPLGADPNFDQFAGMAPTPAAPPDANTSPGFPPLPESGMEGIETAATGDNLGALP